MHTPLMHVDDNLTDLSGRREKNNKKQVTARRLIPANHANAQQINQSSKFLPAHAILRAHLFNNPRSGIAPDESC
jgi:hypothetical protein